MKIGILTSGGDCQSLNAAMRGVVKTLYSNMTDIEIYGFYNGYRGLIEKDYRLMDEIDFSGILTRGGTILGTSRTPFKTINEPDENGSDKVQSMIDTYNEIGLDCLIMLGGNGSHKTASLLKEKGLNIVSLPKTIDNDIYGTDMSFGFHSAIDIAAETIDRIYTTAASHSRVFIIEIMGNKTGWLTLYAGIAGGADIILIPEIPYNMDTVAEAIEKRASAGRSFTIVAVAEGIKSIEESALEKKEYKKLKAEEAKKYPSTAYKLADSISRKCNSEVRVMIPGHMQRGGAPTPYDRYLATRLGIKAAELILDEKYGYMACICQNEISVIPIEEVAGRKKLVKPDSDIIMQARTMGICLGD